MFQVVELKPDWPKGYSRLAAANQGLGDWDDAIDAYKRGAPAVLLRTNQHLRVPHPLLPTGCACRLIMPLHSIAPMTEFCLDDPSVLQ